MALSASIRSAAEALAATVSKLQDVRVVFAESCTAGQVSAALASVPGISQFHCGSAVTYREATKTQWLDVSPADLAAFTAVSKQITRQMAVGVLSKTDEASWSCAITGHLGPDAPPDIDGAVFIAIACRRGGAITVVDDRRFQLRETRRVDRLDEATALALQAFQARLASPPA